MKINKKNPIPLFRFPTHSKIPTTDNNKKCTYNKKMLKKKRWA